MLLDKPIPLAYILNKVKYDIWVVVFIDIIVHSITSHYEHRLPRMPIAIPTFLGTAISVLLSFKINQSYDRWWEARKVWGAIVNDSRTLVLQLQGFLKGKSHPVIRDIAHRQIAWCYALAYSLRDLPQGEEMNKYISDEEEVEVRSHDNMPLALLQIQTHRIRSLTEQDGIDSIRHVQLDSTLVRLCDSMGRAERIKNTVFPRTYRLFLYSFIYLFVITLSIALHDTEIWFEMPLIVLLSLAFLLLQKSAYHLQDPFKNRPSDTAMLTISKGIEVNLLQLVGDKNIPVKKEPEGYYVL